MNWAVTRDWEDGRDVQGSGSLRITWRTSYSYILGNIVAYSWGPPWIFCSRAWGSGLLLASRWSNAVTLWNTKEEYSGEVGSERVRLSLQNHVWFIENSNFPKWILITFCGRNFKNIILNYICNHCVIWLFWNWKNYPIKIQLEWMTVGLTIWRICLCNTAC